MKQLLVFIIFLAILPGVLGASIESVDILFGDQPIEVVGSALRIPARLVLSATIDTPEDYQVHVDISSLNVNSFRSTTYQDQTMQCNQDTNQPRSITCYLTFELWVNQEHIDIPFTFTEAGKETILSHLHTFVVDRSKPQLRSVTTEYQYKGDYVVKSNSLTQLYFDFFDDQATFDLRNIHYSIHDSKRLRVHTCEGQQCTGLFFESCPAGSSIRLDVLYPSSDDAGNEVIGEKQHYFICDAQPPKPFGENSFTYKSSDPLLSHTIKEGDTLTLTYMVQDDATGVTAALKAPSMLGISEEVSGNCVPINEDAHVYACTWQLANLQKGTHEIEFFIQDSTNQYMVVATKKELIVNEFVSPEKRTTPQFFQPALVNMQATYGYNRVAIDLAVQNAYDYPLFGNYQLERTNVGGDLEILYASILPSSCSLLDPVTKGTTDALSLFSNIQVSSPRQNYDQQNRIEYTLLPGSNVNAIPDNFLIVCNLSVIVRENQQLIYQEPTTVVVTANIKFKNSALSDDMPGERYVKRIKEMEKKLDQEHNKIIRRANDVLITLNQVCGTIDKGIADIRLTASTAQLGLVFVKDKFPAGEAIYQVLQTIIDRSRPLNTREGEAKPELSDDFIKDAQKQLNEWIVQACDFATCTTAEVMEKTPDSYLNGKTPLSSLADVGNDTVGLAGVGHDFQRDIFQGTNLPSPQESIVSSVVAQCWSGVIYHLNRYQESTCQQLICVKQQARLGLDSTICNQIQAQFVCEEVIGEAFEVVPYTRSAKNILENTRSTVQQLLPKTLEHVFSNAVCNENNIFKKKGSDAATKAASSATEEATKSGAAAGTKAASSGPSATEVVKAFLCDFPEALGTQLDNKNKRNTNQGMFAPVATEDICAQALCNDPTDPDCTSYTGFLDDILKDAVRPGTIKIAGDALQASNNQELSELGPNYFAKTDFANYVNAWNAYEKNKTKDLQVTSDGTSYSVTYDDYVKLLQDKEIAQEINSMSPEQIAAKLLELQGYDSDDYEAAKNRQSSGTSYEVREDGTIVDPQYAQDMQTVQNYEQAKKRYSSTQSYDDYVASIRKQDSGVDSYYSLVDQYQQANEKYLKFVNEKGYAYSDPEFQQLEKELNQAYTQFDQAYTSLSDSQKTLVDGSPEHAKETLLKELHPNSGAYVDANGNLVPAQNPDEFISSQTDKGLQTYLKQKSQAEEALQKEINQLHKTSTARKEYLTNNLNSICQRDYDECAAANNELEHLNKVLEVTTDNQLTKEQVNAEVLRGKKRAEQEAIDRSVKIWTNAAASYLVNKGYMDWAITTNWGKDGSDFNNAMKAIDRSLDVAEWEKRICSATFSISPQNTADDGVVVQCTNGLCTPVLSFAGEGIKLDSGEYLYSFVFALGPAQASESNPDPIQFNVFLQSSSGEYALFPNEWVTLPYDQYVPFSESVLGKREYTQMCIKFANNVRYPRDRGDAKTTYCRPIRFAPNEQSAFDTGSPVTKNYDPAVINKDTNGKFSISTEI